MVPGETGNGANHYWQLSMSFRLCSKSESVSIHQVLGRCTEPDYYENCVGKEYNANEIYYEQVMDPETGERVFVQIGNLASGTYNANKANYYTAEKVYDYSWANPTAKWPGYSRNYPALVSTEDLKTVRFYDNSAETGCRKEYFPQQLGTVNTEHQFL